MPTIDYAPMHLQASVGQALQIELESLPGAGMVWQAPAAPAGCTRSVAHSRALGAGVGGPVMQCFVLNCDRAAEHVLLFELKRAWAIEVRALQPVWVTLRQ